MARTVIVVGGSGGLGSVIARQFASEGDRVVVHYGRSQKDAEDVVKAVAGGPGETMLYQADVQDFSQIKGMVEATVKKWGQVDVLVNAAGALPVSWAGFPIVDMAEEEFARFLDVDLKGSFNSIKAVAPQMMKQKDGHIIVLGGGSAFRSFPGWANYAACKGGIASLCRTAAKELGAYNIRVNVVCPGATLHPRIAFLLTRQTVSEEKGLQACLPEPQTREELARFIVALSKMKAVSGQVLFSESRIIR